MKFTLRLDESLFDDEFDSMSSIKDSNTVDEFDDEFVDYEPENIPDGPAEGSDTGVASELIALIKDEWEAIEGYNNAIATLRANIHYNAFYDRAIAVLEEISAEENVHVGQLQEVLKQISPNAAEIKNGAQEARTQMGFVGGVLPVQSWSDAPTKTTSQNVNQVDELCTISDIDDDM